MAVPQSFDNVSAPEKFMIWTEEEAKQRQFNQVGTSACGATAALNVLNALGLEADVQDAIHAVQTRLRDLEAPLPQYLLSRSVAGTTHTDIIEGIKILSKNQVDGYFFHFYPERDIEVSSWLKKWMHLGGVPVATLNCQKIKFHDGSIPDAWHHQMIYGVSEKGIHMTNPYQTLKLDHLLKQLCSESLLLIRRDDVLMRWSANMNCSALDTGKWKELQVIENIEKIIKEETLKAVYGNQLKYLDSETSHLEIPAAYKSGITIFAKSGSKAFQELKNINN